MSVNYLFLGQMGNYSVPRVQAVRMETMTILSVGLNFAGTMMIQFTWAYLGLAMDNFFITGNLATVLMAAQIALTGLENTYPDLNFCYASSIAIEYLFTCVFAWMFLYGVWSVLDATCGLPGRASTRRYFYLIFGYVLPWGPIIPVSFIYTDKLINGYLCWLKREIIWFYLGPVYFVCAFNLLVLLFLCVKRWHKDCNKEKKVKFFMKLQRVATTFFSEGQPLGFWWLFGLIPGDGTKYLPFNWIFVCIAGPQNLFMFFLFYCTHKTVLALLASHYEDTVEAALKEVQKKKAARGGRSTSYSESSE